MSERGRSGRPPYAPTDEVRHIVSALVAIGHSNSEIARIVRIDTKTLRKHFRDELKHGYVDVMGRIGLNAIQKALKHDNEMIRFVLTTKGGWVKTERLQHDAVPGSSITVKIEGPDRPK